ncbi:phenylacetate--CoA ligase family protein [Pseudoneobacillus sp. C159]
MDISRIMSIFKRINDLEYIRYGIRRLPDKLSLNIQLKNLEKYHLGEKKDFEVIRKRKLKKILKYAYRYTEFYKETFDKNGVRIDRVLDDWKLIPLLDKEIIRKEKNRLIAVSSTKDYVGFLNTGGSTGQPLGFYILGGLDSEHQEFLYKIMGYKPGDRILAMDGTLVPEELVNKRIFWTKKSDSNLPYGSVALSSHYLNKENIQTYINFIKEFKPSIIRGYPAFIDSLAVYILKNNISLGLSIKGIEITSESAYDYQIDNIRNAFNTKVYNQYGHAESSIFGYSIDETMMTYCSPLYGFTEVIGEDGRHVNQGEIGEVVVTSFNNYAMPFIRYRTGDLALYDGEDSGIVRLRRIFGRTQDYIYTYNMEKVLLTALVFGRHYKAFDSIDKWQIVQNKPGEIIFKIIKNPNFSSEDEEELKENFYDIAKIKTSFEYVDSLPLTQRGKSKFLIQNISE